MPASNPPLQAQPVDTAVRETLQRYSAALGSLDPNAVKKIQPGIDLEGLKRAFKDMRTLEVGIDDVKVLSADATSVRASCRVTQTLTSKGGARQTATVTRVIRLRAHAGTWVIDSFER